eukprot:s664_g26.t2
MDTIQGLKDCKVCPSRLLETAEAQAKVDVASFPESASVANFRSGRLHRKGSKVVDEEGIEILAAPTGGLPNNLEWLAQQKEDSTSDWWQGSSPINAIGSLFHWIFPDCEAPGKEVPATDWQMFWNSPEMVLPEVRERRRYPGLVSASHFEVYCPDPLDLLSGWTFLLSTSDTKRRLRTMSLLKGNQPLTQCSRDGTAGFVHPRDVPRSRCCECGEKVSLVHIPGDMKQWAFVDILFRYHSPFTDWQDKELQTSLTRKLWQKETRFAEQSRAIQESAGKMAELYGGEICFKRDEKRCCTAHNSLREESRVLYKTLNMKPLPPPFRLEVDSTAVADGHLLIGAGPWNSAEIVFGANAGTFSAIRWLWEGSYTSLTAFDGSPQKDASPSKTWKVQVELEEDGRLGVRHGFAEWGFYVPDHFLEILRQSPVQIYVGVPGDLDATWTVCREDLSKQKKRAWGVDRGSACRSGLDQPVAAASKVFKSVATVSPKLGDR